MAHSDDKRRARLAIISHLLSQIPYKSPRRERVKLPKRKRSKDRPPKRSVKLVADVL